MTHNITQQQGIEEARNIKAAMWANRILTRKINNETCKYEIAQSTTYDLIEDMEQRVRKYLKAGLVTEDTYKTAIDTKLNRLRQAASKPAKNYTNGSKDGLWSTEVKRK